MQEAWDNRRSEAMTSPIVANGLLFVASIDAGTLYAMKASDGSIAWKQQLPSRVDSPPTVVGNLCILGCHDGWLYAYESGSGQLAWRSRIAPVDQRVVANGRVESTWPVVGSPLYHQGCIIAHAGRGTEADNGIAVVKLDPASGRTIKAMAISPGPGKRIDLLCTDQDIIYHNTTIINPDSGATRTLNKRDAEDKKLILRRMAGYMLDSFLVGNGRGLSSRIAAWEEGFSCFQAGSNRITAADNIGNATAHSGFRLIEPKIFWKGSCGGKSVNSMALTPDQVIICDGAKKVTVLARQDGKQVAGINLPHAPVYDAMAVADNSIFVVMENGEIVAIGE